MPVIVIVDVSMVDVENSVVVVVAAVVDVDCAFARRAKREEMRRSVAAARARRMALEWCILLGISESGTRSTR